MDFAGRSSALPEANRQAVEAAVARGIEVALVTGRRFDFALPIAKQMALPADDDRQQWSAGEVQGRHDTPAQAFCSAKTARAVLQRDSRNFATALP